MVLRVFTISFSKVRDCLLIERVNCGFFYSEHRVFNRFNEENFVVPLSKFKVTMTGRRVALFAIQPFVSTYRHITGITSHPASSIRVVLFCCRNRSRATTSYPLWCARSNTEIEKKVVRFNENVEMRLNYICKSTFHFYLQLYTHTHTHIYKRIASTVSRPHTSFPPGTRGTCRSPRGRTGP